MGLLRYQSTMGLNRDQIEELVTRVWQILSCRPARRGRRPAVGLHRSVVLTLVLLRSNLNQATLADLEGVSQPTISRIFRRFAPLIEQALCLHLPPVPDAVAQRVVLIDGTLVPTGNRTGQEGNYAGKHRRAGLSVQVLADLTGGLLAVSTPRPGSMHDRRAFTETGFEALLAFRLSVTSATSALPSSHHAESRPADSSPPATPTATWRSPRSAPPLNAPSPTSRTGRYSPLATAAASPNFPPSSASSPHSSSTDSAGNHF